MPGLGDALSKAMEDSRRGLDDLVRRAAEGEAASSQTDVTRITVPLPAAPGGTPAPEADASPPYRPVTREEKDLLVVALDTDGAASPPSPPHPPLPSISEEQETAKTQVIPALPGLAEDGSPGSGAGLPAAPASSGGPAPAPPPEAPAPSSELIAPFAPSGVIRRQLRTPAGAGKTSEVLGGGVPRRPLIEELSQCRRLPALAGAERFRVTELVRGVGGAVKLILSGKLGKPAVVALCGTAPGSGTTTLAAAVALELAAQPGLRVLLVDADFRSPGLAGLAGETGGPGLVEVLAGGSQLDAALICPEDGSAALLPLGGAAAGGPGGLAGLLSGPALGRMLDECRGLFDAVIFDVGAVSGRSAAAELAGAVGTAMLVVRAGRTGAREARAARNALRRSGARVFGAILNCLPAASGK